MKPTRLDTAVRRALQSLGLPGSGRTLVCALSGGADSVALLDALTERARRDGFELVAAHLDHGLRPSASADAAFCGELCGRLGVRLVAARGDVRARARREKGTLEELARAERYAFLRRVKDETGAVAIAVAHTEDDQAETFLLRLLRGSGGAGLQAMRPRSGDVLRPLLGVSRAEVLAHLGARGLPWREDETNRDHAFARNRVRHELIPYLEHHFNPRLRPALARAAELLAAEQLLLDALVKAPDRDASGSVTLALGELRAVPEALARLRVRKALEVTGGLRGVGERHVRRILELAGRAAASGRWLALPGGRSASIRFDRLRIGPARRHEDRFAFPLAVPGRVELPGGVALVAEPAGAPAVSEAVGGVVGVPQGPLLVRTRRAGDRVRVRGRARSLKRYLIEERVPAEERAHLPLVAVGRDVLWLPDRPLSRAGERYVRLRLVPA